MRTRIWPLLLMLFCLVVAPLPRPCQGDGAGQACTAASCQCVTACTCQAAHHAARDLADQLGHADACQTAAERLAACEAMLDACHGDAPLAHFAPAADPGPALIAVTGPLLAPAPGRAAHHFPAGRLPALPPPPRGRPPWTLA